MKAQIQNTIRIAAALVLVLAASVVSAQSNPSTYDDPSDNGTSANRFIVPAGKIYYATIKVWGAGGRGSRANSSSVSKGGGGGGGGFSLKTITLTEGTYYVYVGDGPSAGSTGTPDDGEFSYVSTSNSATNAFVLANGGKSVGTSMTGGDGGSTSGAIGDIVRKGGDGANGTNGIFGLAAQSGGGGAAANENGNGEDGDNMTGGNGVNGGGDGGNGRTNSGSGASGDNPGGGGGGGFRTSGTSNGGGGGNGYVEISWINPEINVRGNNIDITDGTAVTSTTNYTDFGSMTVSSGTVVRQFTIQNVGASVGPLVITDIDITGAGGDFTVTANPASPVAANGSTTFTITFNPSASGTRTATVNIYNNDSNENPYNFNITGVGTDPDIALSGNSTNIANGDVTPATGDGTNFGSYDISAGAVSTTFTITNSGNQTLTLSNPVLSGATSEFTITSMPASLSLAAGATATFTVAFDPTSTGTKNAVVTIASNDPDENPFTFSITGTGVSTPEMEIRGGSPAIAITDGDGTPDTADGTNFGGVYVQSGTISQIFTIHNLGSATLTLSGGVTIGGTNASDFSVTSIGTSVAAGGTLQFTVTFDPNALGTRTATISISNNDSNENPYNFSIQGTGNAYNDSDGDGVTDEADIDDDNDGIRDTDEQTACKLNLNSKSTTVVFLEDNFGTGNDRTAIGTYIPATTGYSFSASGDVNDGSYTVYKNAQDVASWAAQYWWTGLDHTPGDTNGKMAIFNATQTAGQVFYSTAITGLTPGIPLKYEFYVLNLDRTDNPSGSNRNMPNITIEFKTGSTVHYTINTGNIAQSVTGSAASWKLFTAEFTPTVADMTVTFKNNSSGGNGNDLALDDIKISQTYCDLDADGDADIFDLDDDNDGIPDIVEANFQALSNNKSRIATWVDGNGNGMHDTIDGYISANTYATNYLVDTDGDGVKDFMDLDSDNDGIFDIDEAQVDTFTAGYNGDGDVDGDGFATVKNSANSFIGDDDDSDEDGIHNLNDDLVGYGTTNKPYPTITSGGIPNYRNVKSDGVNFDISKTIYAHLDANNDGKIDNTTDTDRDGIVGSRDTSNSKIGSPRDLTTSKYYIFFDGRNDYAESANILGGLAKSSMMCWIKLNTGYNTNGIVIGQDNFHIGVDATKKLYVRAKGTTYTYATALSDEKWLHVGATYTSGVLKLFLNGKIVGTYAPTAGSLDASSYKFTIAKNAAAASTYFKGYIDEVRVFNTNLTDDEFQRIVYQEIDRNGSNVKGSTIPLDFSTSVTWSNMLAYYRMDVYKNNVIDNYVTNSTFDDSATDATFARIYNVKYLQAQSAPMPFVTVANSTTGWNAAVDNPTSFIDGQDIIDSDFAIVQVKHNVTTPDSFGSIGLLVDSNRTLTVANDRAASNSWYLKLDGTIALTGRAQLVQGANSILDATSAGTLKRDQQGTKNIYNYNYWCSPVSSINTATVNNGGYTINAVMRDGTSSAPAGINWTNSSYDGAATSPITLSTSWLYTYANDANNYNNWAQVSQSSAIASGYGYTMKGSGSAADQNYTFVGKPHNGAITLPISSNNLALVGNPYPSALDAVAFIKDNIPGADANAGSSNALDGNLYFWEHSSANDSHYVLAYKGGYSTRNLTTYLPAAAPSGINGLGTPVGSYKIPKRYIPVGQGFFVQANTTGGSISFKNSQRAFKTETDTESNAMFRSDGPVTSIPTDEETFPLIKLGFNTVDHYHRQIAIGFMGDHATDGLDYGYDAPNFDDYPSDMYFTAAGNNLIIQGVGHFDTTASYPLAVKSDLSGEVKFEIDIIEQMDADQPVYLYDNATGIYHDLTTGEASVAIDAGTYTDRFFLRFQNEALSTTPVDADQAIKISYLNDSDVLIINNNVPGNTVESTVFFNMLGQQVAAYAVDAAAEQGQISIPVKALATGTYIVKVIGDKGSISRKIGVR